MMDQILTLLGIYFICWFKFLAGPVLGSAAGYSVIECVLVTVAGMMTSVLIFTLVGAKLKTILQGYYQTKPKPIFQKRTEE